MKTTFICSISALALGAVATPMQAQSQEEPTKLGTIYLEGAKRPQDAFSFSGTVAQANDEALENRNVTSVEDLDRVFGGLSVDMRSSRPYSSFSVRGQASLDFYNPSVGVYVDGIPQDSGSLVQLLPFGVDNVELLYGPQGTLYGSGASGGVLNVTSVKPGDGAPFRYSLSAGDQRNSINLKGETQLGEGIWADLALGYIDEKDHLYLPTGEGKGGSESKNARLRLRFAPEDSPWDIMLSAQRSEVFSDEEYFVPGGSFGSRTVVPYPSHYDQRITTLGLTASYDLGWGTFTSATSYQDRDFDRTIYGYYTPETQTTTTQEFRFASAGSSSLSYVVGGSLSKSNFTREAFGANVNIETQKAALFGDLTWDVTDRLSISPGVRFDWEEAEVNSAGFGATHQAKGDWSEVSPKLGVSYEISDNLQAYGLLSTGYQSGGFSRNAMPSAAVLSYDPQRVKNAEIGLRFASADDSFIGSIAAFAMRTDDLQMFVGTAPVQYLQNVGKAEAKGINIDMRYQANGLGVSAALGYTDSIFSAYNNPLSPGVDLTGNRVPHVPEFTARLGVDYTFDLGEGQGTLTPRLGVSYQSEVWFDEGNTVGQSAYTLVDAGLAWKMENGIELDLYVNNLTDEKYAQYGFAAGPGTNAYTLGRGREVGLTLRQSF